MWKDASEIMRNSGRLFMKAVILAGGEGRRVRPLTGSRPKALIPVADRPIISYPIEALEKNGIRDIIVVVGYRKEQVIRYLNSLDIQPDVIVQEKQLGTADALRCAAPLIDGDFLVLPGDNFIDAYSIGKIRGVRNAMLVQEHPNPSNFGVVVVQEGQVKQIVEKPARAPSFTVSTGIFSLTDAFFDLPPENDITDMIASMLNRGIGIRAIEADDWQDAVYPWDLLSMNARLIGHLSPSRAGSISRNSVIDGPVRIGEGTMVGPGSVITGPAIIGPDSQIGPHTVIGPGTSIGARAEVAPFTLIENSILMDDVRIGSHSRIRDTIIGTGSTLGNHAVVQTISRVIDRDGELIRAEFGAIIGDEVISAPFSGFGASIIGNSTLIQAANRDLRSMEIPDQALVV
jgi:NDP-sugar pyrophosphorylase family protein